MQTVELSVETAGQIAGAKVVKDYAESQASEALKVYGQKVWTAARDLFNLPTDEVTVCVNETGKDFTYRLATETGTISVEDYVMSVERVPR